MSIQKKNFSDLVTFTRASGGTSFRPVGRGTLVNQLLYSQWGGGGTAPTGWLAFGAGGTEGALLPSGMRQRVFTSNASRDFIYSSVNLAANTVYTVAVYVDANPNNAIASNMVFQGSLPVGAGMVVADTVPAAGSFIICTITTAANAGSVTLRVGLGTSNVVTGSVTLSAPAIFTGTVTAQQIIDNGGIPLTFTAADNLLRLDTPGDPIQLFTAPANYPRFDYDPVTRQCKGLLVEEQRTNMLLRSNDFTNAAWIKSPSGAGVAPQLNPQPVAAPDGTMTATRVTLTNTGTTTGDWSWLYSNFSCVSGLAYCASAIIRAATPADVGKQIVWPSVGAIKIITLTADWVLAENAAVCSSSIAYSFGPRLRGTETTTTTVTLDICHAQVEVGEKATSRIPTTGAAATCAADIPRVNTLVPWLNPTEGTIFVEFTQGDNSAADRLVMALYSNAWTNTAMHIRTYGSAVVVAAYNGATAEVNMILGTVATGVRSRVAFAYSNNNYAACLNGGAVSTDTSAIVPYVTTMMLGVASGDGGGSRNGHIGRLSYTPKRLTDAQLQALTTPTYSYGPERVTNGDLSGGATGWTLDAGISVGGGMLNFNTADATPFALNVGTVEAGKLYEAVFFMSGFASGGVSLANNGASFGEVFSANGVCRQTVAATQTGQLAVRARLGPTVASIDNISIREATIV